MTIACKQNNALTDMRHCTSNLCKFYSIECFSLALDVLCFAGPWIQTKSRLGTQAWPFLSSEAPLIQQVLLLETLRYQQQTPHNPDLQKQVQKEVEDMQDKQTEKQDQETQEAPKTDCNLPEQHT